MNIPAQLALNIELLFYDPASRRINYGARSTLVTHLLEQYWNSLPEDRRKRALAGPTDLILAHLNSDH